MPFVEDLKVVLALEPQSQAPGNVLGAAVDTSGFAEAMVVSLVGTTQSGATLDVKVVESDDGESWTSIDGADFVQVTPSNDNAVYIALIRLAERKRYLAVSADAEGEKSVHGAVIVLGDATKKPAEIPAWTK